MDLFRKQRIADLEDRVRAAVRRGNDMAERYHAQLAAAGSHAASLERDLHRAHEETLAQRRRAEYAEHRLEQAETLLVEAQHRLAGIAQTRSAAVSKGNRTRSLQRSAAQ